MQKNIKVLLQPARNFIQKEYASGLILFFFILLALIIANSPLYSLYHHIWEIHFYIGWGDFKLDKALHHWINDGLMSVFFFVIGLELKREIIAGELSSWKRATLPLFAALGGMIIPALIYVFINFGKPTVSGWGIPMATDIAIALGLLTLAGKRVPIALKIFLTALAVVDDLGAVLVIAFFYSSNIYVSDIMIGLGFLLVLYGGNLLGIRHTLFYAIIGILGLWYSFMASGVHPTIGGVLVAFTIPARTKINEVAYLATIRKLSDLFEKEVPNNSTLTTKAQHSIIEKIKHVSSDAETPLQKLEHALHPLVAYVVLPVFAFANSGVQINTNAIIEALNPVTIGIIAGLVIGKAIGVTGFVWIATKVKFLFLPENISWKHIIGVGLLAGVGFTMSIFITDLAFKDQDLVEKAKIGILVASLISGISGLLLLRKA
jgi:NhaA family Na+:H+ antiporter